MGTLPLVFVLDLDGTIVGDVKFQVARYSLHQNLKKHGFRSSLNRVPDAYLPDSRLVRPGFVAWMKAMKQFYPWVEFFIYTASEKKWANQEISWIEKGLGIEFSRPIFTRSDCEPTNYKKSLKSVLPRIFKTVAKKRALSSLEKSEVVHKRLIVVDNTDVYLDYKDRVLLCPDYSYAVFEDIWQGVPNSYIETNAVLSYINQGIICPFIKESFKDRVKQLAKSYAWLSQKCSTIALSNKTYLRDSFWRALRKFIVDGGLNEFSKESIRKLQESCWRVAAVTEKV